MHTAFDTKKEEIMKTAVCYSRFSSINQNSESIEAQLRAIQEYANREGIEIIKAYIDEAESATSDKRPNFQKMIAELKQTKPDYVLTHKMDRFARNRYDSAIYKREIQRAGAKYIAVDQPITDSPEGIILESMLEGMAEYYSANLSREVSEKMKEYARKAKHLGGIPPLGYDVDMDKHYIINESEAEAVRLIFRMFIQGISYGKIIAELNNRGYRTKKGAAFGKNSIHDILRNEKYAGVYIFNRATSKNLGKRNTHASKPDNEQIRIEGAIPAIISVDDYKKAQQILTTRKHSPRQNPDSPYILTGVIKCGHCGGAMTGKNNNGRYYICSRSRRTGECENKKQYKADTIERDVIKAIEDRATNIKNINKFVDILYEEIQLQNSLKSDDEIILTRQLKEIEKKMNNYKSAIEKGLDVSIVIGEINELGRQKKEVEKQLDKIKIPYMPFSKKDIKSYLLAQQQVLPKDDSEKMRKTVADHVSSVTVHGKGDYDIKLKLPSK